MPPRLGTGTDDLLLQHGSDSGTDQASGSARVLAVVFMAVAILVMVKTVFFCLNGACWERRSRHGLQTPGTSQKASKANVREAEPLASDPDGSIVLEHGTTDIHDQTDATLLSALPCTSSSGGGTKHRDSLDGISLKSVSAVSATNKSQVEALNLAQPEALAAHGHRHSSSSSKMSTLDDSTVGTARHEPLSSCLPGPTTNLSKSEPNVLDEVCVPAIVTTAAAYRRFDPATRSVSTEPLDSPSQTSGSNSPCSRSQSFQAPSSALRVVPRLGGKRPRPTLSLSLNPLPLDSLTLANKDLLNLEKMSSPMTKNDLLATVVEASKSHLFQEFWNIPMNQAAKAVACSGPKNRYPTIFPNIESRVLLPIVNDDINSSYINANYMSGYNSKKREYIATQGPLPNTTVDFWRMVWQDRCEIIVMMSLMKESDKVTNTTKRKCDRYWPGSFTAGSSDPGSCADDVGASIQYENFNLQTTACEFIGNAYVHTTMELSNSEGSGDSRTVHHFWFVSWPDQGVPDSPDQLLDLVKVVRDTRTVDTPFIIHCSAGIGRTGCFSAVDIGCQQLKNEDNIDIQGIVARLRKDRGGLVQTCEQYIFLFQCLQLYASQLPSPDQ